MPTVNAQGLSSKQIITRHVPAKLLLMQRRCLRNHQIRNAIKHVFNMQRFQVNICTATAEKTKYYIENNIHLIRRHEYQNTTACRHCTPFDWVLFRWTKR